MKVVIIGGVAAGATAAARLRRLAERADIVILEKGEHISFANCGLPYYAGGVIEEEADLLLQTPQSFAARYAVDVRVRSEAVEIDRGKKTVRVKNLETGAEYAEKYDKLVLATGAYPAVPQIPGIDLPGVFTVRTVSDAAQIKSCCQGKSCALVIGAGYVGLEMAENLTRRGISVCVVEMSDHILPSLDYDMAKEAEAALRKHADLRLSTTVREIRRTPHGLVAALSDGTEVPADLIVAGGGVKPDTGLARSAGIALSERGSILTDETMKTSDPDIYAAGDAVSVKHLVTGKSVFLPLAGPANKQGRVAADAIAGKSSQYRASQGSSVLSLFGLTIASTGVNESAAKAAGLDYEKSFTLSASHAGYYPGAQNISMKLLFEKGTGKVLGAQMVGGEGTEKRCDVIAAVLRLGGTVRDLAELELCYAPPYSSAKDPVNVAGYAAENILNGLVAVHHWHDVEKLSGEGQFLLDVRTEGEFSRGAIAGAVNIPLHTLRKRLKELDSSRKIYVNCQSGFRSYLACRILSQSGFSCSNLSGGYRFYHIVTGK